MRILALALLVAAPTLASAKTKPKPVVVATSDSGETAAARATRLALADDVGARRDASELHAPTMQVAIATPEATGPERGPSEVAADPARATGPISGAMEELIAKQMGRNEGVFDRCIAEARARDPQLRGEILLNVSVAARHATAELTSTYADVALGACLAQSARSLRVSLPDLSFPWKISLAH